MIDITEKEKILAAFKVLRKLFIQAKIDSLFEQYGKQEVFIDSKEYLENLKKIVYESINNLIMKLEDIVQIESTEVDTLKTSITNAMDETILPKNMPKLPSSNETEGATAESEKIKQVAKEQMTLTEVENVSEGSKQTAKTPAHWKWKDSMVFSRFKKYIYEIKPTNSILDLEFRVEGKDIKMNECPYVFCVSDVFKEFDDLCSVSKAFNENLIVSYNHFKIRPIIKPDDVYGTYFDKTTKSSIKECNPQHPFGKFQKPCDEYLVIKDKYTDKFKLMLLDDTDAIVFHNDLISDKEEQQSKEVNFCLYDFSTGVISEGSESLKDELETSEEFLKLKVQAKFLRGELSYSKQEQKLLKEWFKAHDHQELQKLFEQKILPKSLNSSAYSSSPIAKIFRDIAKGHGSANY